MVRPDDLPTFRKPPIDEVAIGLFFEPTGASPDLVAFRLFEKLRPLDYDGLEVQSPLMLDEEHPEEPIAAPVGQPPLLVPPTLVSMTSPQNRYWITSKDTTQIVQLQSDAFYTNWRKRNRSAVYPRFEALLAQFRRAKEIYLSSLNEMDSAPPSVKVLEVIYINWIAGPMHEWFRPAGAGLLSGHYVDVHPEGSAWQAHYPILEDGVQVGRLKVESQSAIRLVDDRWERGTQFSLRARLASRGALNEVALDPTLNIGRASIVHAFKDLTTASAHIRWELEQ